VALTRLPPRQEIGSCDGAEAAKSPLGRSSRLKSRPHPAPLPGGRGSSCGGAERRAAALTPNCQAQVTPSPRLSPGGRGSSCGGAKRCAAALTPNCQAQVTPSPRPSPQREREFLWRRGTPRSGAHAELSGASHAARISNISA
jgi:hypothetical protein